MDYKMSIQDGVQIDAWIDEQKDDESEGQVNDGLSVCMYGWVQQKLRLIDRQINGRWMNIRLDGWVERFTDEPGGLKDGWLDGRMYL